MGKFQTGELHHGFVKIGPGRQFTARFLYKTFQPPPKK